KDNIHLRFHFITKISGEEMNHTLNVIERKEIPYPDIIVVNSCMWDVTRWGPMREDDYKEDLIKFFSRIKKILPEDTLVIWTSTLPISTNFTKGGVLIKQLEFMKFSLRFMILEANKFTHQLCIAFGVDFLDLHYHMRFQLHRRSVDGIHWEPQATRYITCLLLTHISLAFDVPLPGRVKGKYIQDCIDVAHNSKDIEPEWSLERGITLRLEEELSRLKIAKKPKLERESSKKSEEDKKETDKQLGNRGLKYF
ncbi:PC-esterase domain-containing protein 1A, partial [Armadillidium nasatum]